MSRLQCQIAICILIGIVELSDPIFAVDSQFWIQQLEANSLELKQLQDALGLSTTGTLLNLSQYNPRWNLNFNSLPSYSWSKSGYSFSYGVGSNITIPFSNGSNFSLGVSDQMNVSWSGSDWNPNQNLSLNTSLSLPLIIKNTHVQITPDWARPMSSLSLNLAETIYQNRRNQLLVMGMKQMLDYYLAHFQADFQQRRADWQNTKTSLFKEKLVKGELSWGEYFRQVQTTRSAQRDALEAKTNVNNLARQYATMIGDSIPQNWMPTYIPEPMGTEKWPSEGLWPIGLGKEDHLQLSLASSTLERAKEMDLGNFSLSFSATPSYSDPFTPRTFQESWGDLLSPEAVWRFSLQGGLSFSGTLGPMNDLKISQSYANYKSLFDQMVQNRNQRTLQRNLSIEQQGQNLSSYLNWKTTVSDSESFQKDIQQAVAQGLLPKSSENESFIDLEYSRTELLSLACNYWKNYFDLVILTKPDDLEKEINLFWEQSNGNQSED